VAIVSARGVEWGSLFSSWSYIMLPPGKVLVRTYLLSLWDDKTFQPGDSGAWVVDASTDEVYGHVVATDVFGRGYVVPICDSFEDIKNRLSVGWVSLPSQEEIFTFNRPPLPPPAPVVQYQAPQPVVQVLDTIIDSGLRSARAPLQASGIREYLPPVDGSSVVRRHSSWTFPEVPLPSRTYEPSKRTLYQVPDSGYSSMNTTPNHSPPVSPPQSVEAVPPGGWSPEIMDSTSRPARVQNTRPVEKPTYPESSSTRLRDKDEERRLNRGRTWQD